VEEKCYLGQVTEDEQKDYNYIGHEDSVSAGYAGVYAYRQYLKVVNQFQGNIIKREVIRSSLKFADRFPENKNAAIRTGLCF